VTLGFHQCKWDLCWPDVTQHRLVFSYWHFRAIYWLHLQLSRSPRRMDWTLEERQICCPYNIGNQLPIYGA